MEPPPADDDESAASATVRRASAKVGGTDERRHLLEWTSIGIAMHLTSSTHTGSVEASQPRITGAREGRRLTAAGLRAGHTPEVEHTDKRFRLVCPCGWHSDARWTRKRTFLEASQHVITAGRDALAVNPDLIPEAAPAPAPAPVKKRRQRNRDPEARAAAFAAKAEAERRFTERAQETPVSSPAIPVEPLFSDARD